jgi:hypothetical protein
MDGNSRTVIRYPSVTEMIFYPRITSVSNMNYDGMEQVFLSTLVTHQILREHTISAFYDFQPNPRAA